MRITDIHIDGFGVWNDLRLRSLSPEVTVFYGPNEAGKTTLLEFLRSMLYGIPRGVRERYLPPLNGGKPGGSLGLTSDSGPFESSRYVERGDDDRGRVTVRLAGGEQEGDRLLRDALEGIDEATFNNVFAVGLDEIQTLGSLSGSEAAKAIYRLTSGIDRVSLYDVLMDMRAAQAKLLAPAGTPSRIGDLVARRDVLATEIGELTTQGRRWARLAVEMAELDAQADAVREKHKAAERAARRAEVAVGLKPNWAERAKVDARLAALGGLYRLPETAPADLDALNAKIEEHRRQHEIHRGQRRQLRQEAEGLGVNRVLMRSCCRLEALGEQQEWLESLERDALEGDKELAALEARMTGETQRLAKVWAHDPGHAPTLTRAMVDELEPQAKAIAQAERAVDSAAADVEAKRQGELQLRGKIESAAAAGDKLGLPTDIKEAGDLVARLRKRVQVEQQLEQTRRQALDLEQQGHELLDRQVVPIELFILLTSIFVLGFLMLGWWWWYPQSAFGRLGGWGAVLGIGGSIAAWLVKFYSEENAAEQLDGCQRQMEIVHKQVRESRLDQERLDADLPLSDGSVTIRLENAERHLAQLEQTLPIESKRRQAKQEAVSAEAQLEAAQGRLKRALGEWTASLRGLGLPEKLSPADVRTMATQHESLAELELRVTNRRDEADRRRREYDKVVGRITALAQEADLVKPKATPAEQLQALLAERRLQQTRIDTRKQLIERSRDLRDKALKHAKTAESLAAKRLALFAQAGVADEAGYRALAADLAEADKLSEKRGRLTREIVAAIGRLGTEEEFAPLFAPEAVSKLDGQWERLTAEQEALDRELRDLVSRRGALEEQQKALAEDASLADRQMELDLVEAQLAEAKEQWRERAVIGQLLELIRSDYEAHRQPETLLEATRYLSELTGGRYVRIWTPMANDVLLVDDRDGRSMAVEALSRGSREQLFLSVRMALVAMYARRGVQLPMILDDVLVNFDAGRTRTAARVLCDFAKRGHQLLVFTCHEHVWEMFRDLNADVRRLPVRDGEAVEPAPEPLPPEPVLVVEAPEPEPEPLAPTPEPVWLQAEYDELEPVLPEPAEELEFAYEELPPRDQAPAPVERLLESVGLPLVELEVTHPAYTTPQPSRLAEAPLVEAEYSWGDPADSFERRPESRAFNGAFDSAFDGASTAPYDGTYDRAYEPSDTSAPPEPLGLLRR